MIAQLGLGSDLHRLWNTLLAFSEPEGTLMEHLPFEPSFNFAWAQYLVEEVHRHLLTVF